MGSIGLKFVTDHIIIKAKASNFMACNLSDFTEHLENTEHMTMENIFELKKQ